MSVMFYFLIILLVLAFFPFLLIPVLIFLVIGFLFMLPYVIIFNSFYSVITIPWQMVKIAADKRIRKNHSLEHATINVLEHRYGSPLKIGGLAQPDGFSLSGPDLMSPYEVIDATREGYYRMLQGETNLAIHPRCGTSIAAGNFLFSLIFILVLLFSHRFSIFNLLAVILLANIIAKPFGLTLQKYFTTYPQVDDIAILDIYIKPQMMSFPFEFIINSNRSYFIKTSSSRFN